MTQPKHPPESKIAHDLNEPYFIEEGDDDPLHGQLPPHPTLYRARELYDVRPGETLREAMDRASREAEDAAAANAAAQRAGDD
ncbi:hypothetical protein [Sinimarinibacterium flocculans]|uniref:Uncharacterized protein n=1 Tax=Sinimarinibacterium flocculans TaxID=985250 RepID=A0A318E0X0_9GAMM|nr:hypothetical protein [Sinimarinibacterium flocculans]MEC9362924.1 hypothetical protein [Pseudomonadota bacterium]PXV62709.1 hypothetical protein C8D93_1282 [Sinimarinibacterium flocculans]